MDFQIFPAFQENNVPVVLSVSNLYVPYAGVYIQSLINCADIGKNYDIIIFEYNISEENKRILRKVAGMHSNISIRFFDTSCWSERVESSKLEKYFTAETYCKILAPFALVNYPTIIVSDVDMLLKRDIAEVLTVKLDGNCLAAVKSIFWEGACRRKHVFKEIAPMDTYSYTRDILKMRDPYNCINGGLLVIDVEQYCSAVSVDEIIQLISNQKLIVADQDVLNCLMKGKIQFLDTSWNIEVSVNHHSERIVNSASSETLHAYHCALENPALLHWASRPKPWVCPDVPYGSEWWEVATQTPFIGHIIARMVDALEERRSHYMRKYGTDAAAWNPVPDNVLCNPAQ